MTSNVDGGTRIAARSRSAFILCSNVITLIGRDEMCVGEFLKFMISVCHMCE
jgi:hypothetical protein